MAHPPIFLGSFTSTGRREENQDNHLCLELNHNPKGNVKAALAVADGLGGEVGGEVASQLAVEFLRDYIQKWSYISLDNWRKNMLEVYQGANQTIVKYGEENNQFVGMGTTFVCALVVEGHLVVGNVGDSKLYRISGKKVQQVTRDHNMLAQYIAKKKYSLKYLRKKEADLSSSLLRCLGDEEIPKVDMFPNKKSRGFPLKEGDVYILCSDGLTGSPIEPLLHRNDILKILASTPNMKKVCKKLTNLAYRNGSDDNITIVAMRVGNPRPQKKRIITGSLRLPRVEG